MKHRIYYTQQMPKTNKFTRCCLKVAGVVFVAINRRPTTEKIREIYAQCSFANIYDSDPCYRTGIVCFTGGFSYTVSRLPDWVTGKRRP